MKKGIVLLCVIAIVAMVAFVGCDKILKIVTVKTDQYSNLRSTSVVLKGEVVSTGGADEVSERGFFYGTSKNLRQAESVECGHGKKGTFEATVKGLQPNTKYYYQAYAKNDDDLDVGDVLEFTTFELNFTIVTEQPEIGSLGRVVLKGSYDNRENLNIEKIGFEYAKNANFRNAEIVYADNVQSPFSVPVELDDASYYCRAFMQAEDSSVVVKADYVAFASVNHDAPIVNTGAASNVTATSAQLNATVTAREINLKGFYWSENSDFSNPTKVDAGPGLGNGTFAYNLTGLSPATTYYYKAYVTYTNIDQSAEVLGEQKSFHTADNK